MFSPLVALRPAGSAGRLPLFAALVAACTHASAIDVGRGATFERQRLEAWGTSLAWWANGVGGWTDADARSKIVESLFDQENGLGLNYARYNIGGGQNRSFAGNFRPGALVQGWVPTAPSSVSDTSTWVWNLNADATQRRVLDEAISLGAARVDAISYSAPFWMTNSQDSAGGVNGAPNLPSANVDELAHYQAEVVGHFYNNLGVQFQAFSPLNEPDVNYWVAGGQQEGMVVPDGTAQRQVIQAVGQAFATRGLPIGLAGTEEPNTAVARNSWNRLDTASRAYITQIHTHVYSNDNGTNLTLLRDTAAAAGKKIYQSEYGNNSSTGLLGGVALAQRITRDINDLGVSGWAYWQAVEPTSLSGAGWGLLWAGYGQVDSGHVVRKQFHVMRQFSSAIRPGSTILDTNDSDTVAAYDPVADTTVLVVSNFGTTPLAKSYSLLDGTAAFVRATRTSDGEDFAALGRRDTGATIALEAVGPSVTTLVLHHKPNLISNAYVDYASGAPVASLDGGWRASGTGGFRAEAGLGGAVGGVAAITATPQTGPGAVWQEGIGDAGVDLTGKAFQLSLDVQLTDQSTQAFDANATIALEFYGADGQTLAHASVNDFATTLDPITDDTQWRTFRTPALVAPAGTRFVRPVARVESAATGFGSTVRLDNFYLQETRVTPRGRHWVATGNGTTESATNWEVDSSRELHDRWLFGPSNLQAASVTVAAGQTLSLLTFDSPLAYRIGGAGSIVLSADAGEEAMVDARLGSHSVQVPVSLASDAVFQAVGDSSLQLTAPVNLAGNRLRVQGAGSVTFAGALTLGGGVLEVFATPSAGLTIAPSAVLDGTLRVLLEPGVAPALGDEFELVGYSAAVVEFASVALPELGGSLDWELSYGGASLTASVVQAILEGDYNDDGLVDAADYTVWRDSVGAPAGTLPNDPHNAEIGPDQLATWRANFGAQRPGPLATTTVPEPSAWAVLALAAALSACRSRI